MAIRHACHLHRVHVLKRVEPSRVVVSSSSRDSQTSRTTTNSCVSSNPAAASRLVRHEARSISSLNISSEFIKIRTRSGDIITTPFRICTWENRHRDHHLLSPNAIPSKTFPSHREFPSSTKSWRIKRGGEIKFNFKFQLLPLTISCVIWNFENLQYLSLDLF